MGEISPQLLHPKDAHGKNLEAEICKIFLTVAKKDSTILIGDDEGDLSSEHCLSLLLPHLSVCLCILLVGLDWIGEQYLVGWFVSTAQCPH
jgi:hypothetical protein